jgi:hypothetical protein
MGNEWFCEFTYSPANGLGYERGVHRRDPSSVLKVGELYYVWYSKSVGPHIGFGSGNLKAKVWPWDYAEVWYATSPDGVNWSERGMAVGRGSKGAYDDRSVFTPDVLAHQGKFYLVYQTVQAPYLRRTKNTVGLATAGSPDGPWHKLPEPILRASDTGEWLGEEDNRFLVKSKGDFDSHKVHDPSLFYYKGQYWLCYKGEIMGEQIFFGGRETKWGVAIADQPHGPYVRSELNPITNSGHETLLWHYDGGIAALLTTDGPEKNTIQYARDGLNFEIVAVIKNPPIAGGPFRPDPADNREPLDGLRWGLCHLVHRPHTDWGYIQRFQVDEGQKKRFSARKPIA